MTSPEHGIAAEAEAARTAETERHAREVTRLEQRALIAGLAVAATDLKTAAEGLHRASILSRVERLALLGSLILNLAIGGALGYGVIRLNSVADTNRANGQIVVDCTQPGGSCYDRAEKQTADAVARLSLVTVIAVECADQLDGAAVQSCIERRLKAGK